VDREERDPEGDAAEGGSEHTLGRGDRSGG